MHSDRGPRLGLPTPTPPETEMRTETGTRDPATSLITLATSQEIRDRGSAFVGYVYRARTAEDARKVLQYHHANANANARSTKEAYGIAAWRCMVVKPGRTGLGGPDEFEVEEGCEDGGERWAGKRVLGVMRREGAIDGVVIVRRWFGGTLLGPVRFTHIETCAGEVCRRFKRVEEMEECIQSLKTLDDLLATLRAQLATTLEQARTTDPSSCHSRAKNKVPDYRTMQEDLDLTKARRLIHARECAIKNTKTLIEKYNTSTCNGNLAQ
ncbi:ribosomal protein S5 domain 2-type protein [Butyriboletus roseoflavus]|nr:ribosomal protein S5 domain 2-type protein [Butyriboletus roseoflavus]